MSDLKHQRKEEVKEYLDENSSSGNVLDLSFEDIASDVSFSGEKLSNILQEMRADGDLAELNVSKDIFVPRSKLESFREDYGDYISDKSSLSDNVLGFTYFLLVYILAGIYVLTLSLGREEFTQGETVAWVVGLLTPVFSYFTLKFASRLGAFFERKIPQLYKYKHILKGSAALFMIGLVLIGGYSIWMNKAPSPYVLVALVVGSVGIGFRYDDWLEKKSD